MRIGQILSALFVSTCIAGDGAIAQTPTPTQVDRDFAVKSSEIHWPLGFSPADADLFAHNEISINAPCSVVWSNIIHAEKWPEWYPNAKNVKVIGGSAPSLDKEALFEWSTFGLDVKSRVSEFVSPTRIGWFGNAPGLDAYHTWLLGDRPGGCAVITEEVVKGAGAIDLRKSDPDAMHKGHDLWNDTLKKISESKV